MREGLDSVNTGDRPAPPSSTALWLEAVAPGQWHIAEVRSKGRLKAWMPYVLKRGPLGLTRCSMPRLTQTLGPYIVPSNRPYPRALSEEHRLSGELISQLPPCDYFSQNFHFTVQNNSFFWADFKQRCPTPTQSTASTTMMHFLSRMHRQTRQDIRRAKKVIMSVSSARTILMLF